ncbi:hypothetical protein GGF37_004093, partial [Kickxella alabastrina]
IFKRRILKTRFLRKNAPAESAEPESTATPETLLRPRLKPKRVRKNPSAPASSLCKRQRTD